MPFKIFVGAWLRMNTVVLTAYPQNSTGMRFAFIMLHGMPTSVWFRCSTTSFCCGEYGRGQIVLHATISTILREFY